MLRVGLLGHGAIGSQIAAGLAGGQAPGAQLSGVLDPWAPHPQLAVESLDELVGRSDLVVEAAGHDALKTYGAAVRRSGTDLLVVSAGALADDELLAELRGGGFGPPDETDAQLGQLYITTGGIGGLDTLRAAALLGSIESVEMISTKPAQNLVRPWMDDQLRDALAAGADPVVAFEGSAREACGLFPESANVSATVSLATVGFDATKVKLIGDPSRQRVRHEIKVASQSGDYSFSFENKTSPQNPKTSAIVPFAVLRALRSLAESDEVVLI